MVLTLIFLHLDVLWYNKYTGQEILELFCYLERYTERAFIIFKPIL